MRLIFGLMFWVSACVPAMAEPVWFVSLANIKPGKEAQYENFLKAVTPIWNRHGMSVVIRVAVVDGIGEPDFTPPQEIAVLEAKTREGFHAYINDPDYQAIKTQRTDATDFFAVLEGRAVSAEGIEYLSRNPMAVLAFDTQTLLSKGNLDIAITLAGQVKGTIPDFLERVKRVRVHPLSFDDNPTQYARKGTDALAFVGERLD